MTKSRGINKPRAVWTDEMVAAVIARYPHEKTEKIALDLGLGVGQVFSKATNLGLEKTQVYLASPDACRLRREDSPGIAFRFPKGHVPANKGVKGISYPGMEATQFKKGQLSPRCQAMLKQIGDLRINSYGYLERKITMGLNGGRRWRAEHRLVWEAANGIIPDGHVVVFKPGMRSNILEEITLDKVELISRRELMNRNTLHNYPKEIALCIQLRGAVNRKINRRLKDERATTTK